MSELAAVFLPGMMLMWVYFIAQNGMNDVFIEHEKTTLRRMCSSALTVSQIIISKLIFCFVLCLIAELLMVFGAWFLFGVNWGNMFLLILVLSVSNLASVGLMALVFSLSKSREGAGALSAVVIIYFAATGGGMMPYMVMPDFLKTLAEFSMIRWGAAAIETTMDGKGIADCIMPMTKLAVAGILTLIIGSWRFKRRIETGEL